jgi:hypothetical protein
MDHGFGQSGFRRADHRLVGLEEPAADTAFATRFTAEFAPRLAARRDGFAILFADLASRAADTLIVETGTLRIADNWSGDGQSTYMFDQFVQAETRAGRAAGFFSIDVDLESLAVARRACSHATNLVCNDSVYALHTLARQLAGGRLTLLYLDSFNLDPGNPLPSARHHMMELTAAAPLLATGSLVAIDDYAVGGTLGGKGLLVDAYMQAIDATVLYSGYQKIWRMP